MTMPVLILVGLVAAGCGQEECVPWIEEGGRYSVTVGEEITGDRGRFATRPDRISCGESFDLEPGDQFTLIETGPRYYVNSPGCVFHVGTARDIPNVQIGGPQQGAGGDAVYFFVTQPHSAVIGEQCEGIYDIGLVVEGPYDSDPPYPGRIIISRAFIPENVEACLGPGAALAEDDFACADEWYAQVENERGEVVAEFP